jgi:hypothetical protein
MESIKRHSAADANLRPYVTNYGVVEELTAQEDADATIHGAPELHSKRVSETAAKPKRRPADHLPDPKLAEKSAHYMFSRMLAQIAYRHFVQQSDNSD